MSATLFTVRCSRCKGSRIVNGTLEFARMAVCESCRQRMTVVGHEEPPPPEPASVTKAPGIEHIPITERTTEIARGLVLSAFEGKE